MDVGLVGCGAWGKLILRDLVQLGCRVAVVARSAGSIANAKSGGAAAVVGGIEDLERLRPAGAVVATPSSTHGEVLRALGEVLPRVPVFCEKPLTVRAAEAEAIAAARPRDVFVMDKWRYHPGVLELGRIARERRLGDVLGVRTERLGWGIPHDDADAVWHLMPHDLSIVREVLGAVPPLRWSHVESLPDGRAAGAEAVFEGAGRPWACCRVSVLSPLRIRRAQLVCSGGVAMLEDGYATSVRIARGRLDGGDAKPAFEDVPIAETLPLLAELEAFVGFLRGGPPPKSSAAEAAESVALIERILAPGRTA